MSKVASNGPSSKQDPPTLVLEDGASKRSSRRRQAHVLQVQAFLNAADEVDIDEEVENDLLDGLEGDLNLSNEIEVDIEDDNQVLGPGSIFLDEIPEDVDNGDPAIKEEGAHSICAVLYLLVHSRM